MTERDDSTPARTMVDPSFTREDVDSEPPRTGPGTPGPDSSGSGSLRMLGRFEILRELGRGGMGRVFKAWDPARGEQVAVKVLLGFSSASFYRFKREFRSLSEVSHPNLVKLHELFFEDGRLFFSMELLQGVDFVQYCRNFDGPDIDHLRPALAQLAQGVHGLHQAGKLHRDIKPSNIMVNDDGRVVLLDFGLIRERDEEEADLTAPGAVLGTPAYMSPEQAAGLPIGPESDWYAVGLVLYEALTGRRPFEDNNPARLMRARLLEDPAPPSSVELGIPTEIDELCARLLRRKVEERPTPEQVLDRVGASSSLPATPRPSESGPALQFVGRQGELNRLHDALTAVQPGRPVCVFVHGPSGIGKSELIRHFLDGAVDDIGMVLSGRCYERESVPYKAFDSVVDDVADRLRVLESDERDAVLPAGIDALARLFPVLGRVASISRGLASWETAVDDGELRARAFAALKDLFRDLAGDGVLVVTVDDLQWCDMDSVALLLELLQPPDAPPMLMISSHRSEQLASAPPLQTLLGALESDRYAVDVRDLPLRALDPSDCVELVGVLLGSQDGEIAQRAEEIARESDGSPLFLTELVRYARHRADQSSPGELELSETPRLEQVLRERILAMPDAAQQVLTSIAIAGQRIEQGVALRAALGNRKDRSTLDTLRSAKLIRTQGVNDRDWVETYHDRIRETVVSALEEQERRRQHLHLAEALAGSGRSDPDALATHFEQAGASERTVPHALGAARAAAQALAFVRAIDWFEVALGHLPADDERRLELEIELGQAYANAGHAYEAAQCFVRAAERSPAEEQPGLQRRAAHFLVASGNLGEARAMLTGLLGGVGLKMPPAGKSVLFPLLLLRARIAARGLDYRERPEDEIPAGDLHRIDLCWAAGHLVPFDRLLGASFFARHLLLALDAGEPGRIAPALALEATSRFISGSTSYAEARELLRRAEQVADRSGSPEARAWVANAKPPISLLAGNWSQGVAEAEEAIDLLRRHAVGSGVSIMTCRYIELWCRNQLGEWDQLEAPLRQLLRSGGRHNPLHWSVRSLLAMPVALARDRPEEALHEFELYAQTPPDEVYGSAEVAVFSGRIASHLYQGDADAAWKHVEEQRKLVEQALRFRDPLSKAMYHSWRAQAALAGASKNPGRLSFARKAVAKLGKTGFRPARTLAALGRAGVAYQRGAHEESEQLLRQCVDEFEGFGMKIHAAAARARLGSVLGGDRGTAFIRESEETMQGCGIVRPDRIVEVFAAGFPPVREP